MAENDKLTAERDFAAFYRSNNFSISLEKEALEKLITLDTKNGINSISILIDRVGNKKGNDFRQSLLFLFDLVSKVNYQFLKYTGNYKKYNLNRALIIQGFSAVERKEDLKPTALAVFGEIVKTFDIGCRSSNPVVEKAKSYIDENYQKKLSLSKVSTYINVSKNYLCTLFKKECGQTITQYIHCVRMNRSEFLLKATNSTISEIAFQVGYQTYRDFYRNFRKYRKISPKDYKRRFLQRNPASRLP